MSGAEVKKSREMTELHAQFVSLVDAAANKHVFAIAKADRNGKSFEQRARIVLKNDDSHYVTGVVYEPMTEDTQGDFMTADEIQKAAYWYMKNAQCVDVQHSFESEPGACVVESWVEKADITVGNQDIKAGTWMMTMEITDDDLWDAVEKGGITGFSVGGTCIYGADDVELETSKTAKEETTVQENENNVQVTEEKRGFLVKMAKMLGLSNVIKGDVTDEYEKWNRGSSFWNAFDALESTLRKWDAFNECYIYQTDETKIKEALMEFSAIITDILADTADNSVVKAVNGPKTDEKRVTKHADDTVASIKAAYEQLGAVVKSLEVDTNNKEKEESEVNKAEVEAIIKAELAKAGITKAEDDAQAAAPAETPEAPAEEAPAAKEAPEAPAEAAPEEEAPAEVTQEAVEKMVADAVAKAMKPAGENLTMDQVAEIVNKAVADAVAPIAKHTGVPSNMNGETVEKQATEQHYLAGIL